MSARSSKPCAANTEGSRKCSRFCSSARSFCNGVPAGSERGARGAQTKQIQSLGLCPFHLPGCLSHRDSSAPPQRSWQIPERPASARTGHHDAAARGVGDAAQAGGARGVAVLQRVRLIHDQVAPPPLLQEPAVQALLRAASKQWQQRWPGWQRGGGTSRTVKGLHAAAQVQTARAKGMCCFACLPCSVAHLSRSNRV